MAEQLPASAPEHFESVFRREFQGETDRAAVILSAALLDSALETLLKACFVPCPTSTDSLLEGSNAPLASFSSRIDIAYRIGLISSQFARDLHLIRRIRNDFAHNIAGCSFADSSVRNRVLELSRSHKLFDGITKREYFTAGVRGDFEAAVSWMQWKLRTLTEEVSPIPCADTEWGYHHPVEPGDIEPEQQRAQDAGEPPQLAPGLAVPPPQPPN